MNMKCPDTIPLFEEDAHSTEVADYFEFDSTAILPNSETAKAMSQIYGILPKEFKRAARNLANYPDLEGLPVAPLTALNGGFGGLRFINLIQGDDIIIGHGGIMFNEDNKSLLLVTEDSQTAFKLSDSKYRVLLLNKIGKRDAQQLKKNLFRFMCNHYLQQQRRP